MTERKSPLIHDTSVIDDTAIIDKKVVIGANTKVWHFSHIISDSVIGQNCTIGQNVMIGPKVTVGNGCKVQNNVSIYEGVELEDEVFCGPSCVFTNVYNPRAFIIRKNEIRKTLIRKGATIGANATIICGVTIGRYAMIGAGAVIRKDVPDYAVMVGVPAKHIGWVCQCGLTLEVIQSDISCTCGLRYQISNNQLIPEPPR